MSTTDTLERHEAEATTPRVYGAVVSGALIALVGALLLLDALDLIDLRASMILPAVLTLIGLALIVGSFNGPHPGMITAGVFVTLGVLAMAATPPEAFSGGVGGQEVRVTDEAALETSYEVGVGELTLDLSDLLLATSKTVEVNVGMGNLTITLPPDLAVDITALASAGRVELLGENGNGVSVTRTYVSEGFESADVTLTLDLEVAAGNIEVDR
jgi:Cell wall-active antibiotics response 4TMS YvqF